MNIHEYQGKSILKQFGVPVPEGDISYNSEEAVNVAKKINIKTGITGWAVKAQIHAGGRGKAGGIKIAKTLDEVKTYAKQILGMILITPQTGKQGKKVEKVLIEQNIYYPGKSEIKEYYISILLNRKTNRNIIMYSNQGGMDIETIAEKSPELIFTEDINPKTGLSEEQALIISKNLKLDGKTGEKMVEFIISLYHAYIKSDALLIEINPAIKTTDNKIIAADAKVILDDNAIFRHKEYLLLKDKNEENPEESEAEKFKLNYIKLNGNIGCMVNGAGLAMATMDIIKLSGGEPANFLDVGGSANAEGIEAGFNIILKDPHVKAILINIFGGIVRCDRVATGVIEAYKKLKNIKIPVIVRLQGTNAFEGKKIIDQSGLKVNSATTLQDAASLVKELIHKN